MVDCVVKLLVEGSGISGRISGRRDWTTATQTAAPWIPEGQHSYGVAGIGLGDRDEGLCMGQPSFPVDGGQHCNVGLSGFSGGSAHGVLGCLSGTGHGNLIGWVWRAVAPQQTALVPRHLQNDAFRPD